ncbi:MAG: flagellar basal body rod protein FlgB [Ignavibacteriae bacterium HGW-Ignavibacteriae-2]|jgi:flagellar basal-body rod protein FlgB|nr:flagellar basal body rod protein FlgB [Bacteroidota bacterium]PKL87421.1 MAG: flagellar basal body rod protein FlgB [Ignavibacteriae bacterium HGW-Ignavibacteriae-2]
MSSIKELEKFITFCTAKNKVISKNIANVGSKNYQREDVVFKDVLAEQTSSRIKTTNSKHLNQVNNTSQPFEIKVDKSEDLVSGINNVDIENEMANLAENTINFKFASKKINSYYQTLNDVIRNGG